ncbi:hypothetical protein DV737_g1625, partial [Chaetothyriales sp. CBS 132003]
MALFDRKAKADDAPIQPEPAPQTEATAEKGNAGANSGQSKHQVLPTYNHNGHLVSKWVQAEGESGRSGFQPANFFKLVWRSSSPASSYTNVLWPFVPAAIALHFAEGEHHVWTFAINYIAMVPAANLLGYAGQELARKLPKVAGILIETCLGSVVEIVLLMVLVATDKAGAEVGHGNLTNVIQAAILGSILTNLLLCLGGCFLVGGIRHKEQKFHAVISETGSGILLVAGFALLIPSAFYSALSGSTTDTTVEGEATYTIAKLRADTLTISHGVACILVVAFGTFIVYNAVSHDNIFNEVLEADEEMDRDRHKNLRKAKLTLTECLVAISLSLTIVSLIAVFLVEEIEFIVTQQHIPDNFVGLILASVPLVEKAAEHLTTIDEAHDNMINSALFHCIGPSIQTALFNGPLAVIVSWGLGKSLSLNFEIFMVVVLVLSILVVGNFLRDGSSNWLEGALLLPLSTESFLPAGNSIPRGGVPFSPVIITKAQGTRLYDANDKSILDFTSGQMSSLLGHSHPEIVRVVQQYVAELDHLISNMVTHPVVELAERLARVLPAPLEKSFFLSTGSETTEAAIKMAKCYTGNFEIVAFAASYHGLTQGSGSATYSAGRKNGGPAMPGQLAFPAPYAYRSPFRKPDGSYDWEIEMDFGWSMIDRQSVGSLAAFIMEPILSTGGILDLPEGYLQRMVKECRKRGMLVIMDEAQTGVGRTGQMFAFQKDGIVPDILALSKTLGCGLPLASVTTTAEIERGCKESKFLWLTTHLNDPLTAAVGCKVLEIVERDNICQRATERGEQLRTGLLKLKEKYWCIGDIRGRGLLQGVEIISDPRTKAPGPDLGQSVSDRALSRGLSCNIVNLPGMGGVFRLAPPVTVAPEEIEEALCILDEAFGHVLEAHQTLTAAA